MIMATIDASRKDLVEEFRKTPVGHQSVELQKMMNVMRGERFPAKHILICTKPYNEWQLAQLTGVRGAPPKVIEGVTYNSIEDAEWGVFKIRWKVLTGEDLD